MCERNCFSEIVTFYLSALHLRYCGRIKDADVQFIFSFLEVMYI